MRQSINAFLPMRAGSERVPKKNTKTFSGIQGGLCRIKLEQLIEGDIEPLIEALTEESRK